MEKLDNLAHLDIERYDERTGNHQSQCFQETENLTKSLSSPCLKVNKNIIEKDYVGGHSKTTFTKGGG